MKLKNLKKKIRRLEARLQEGPKKLAKLKRKLEAATAASAEKARRKAVTRARAARQPVKPCSSDSKEKCALEGKGSNETGGREGARHRQESEEKTQPLTRAPCATLGCDESPMGGQEGGARGEPSRHLD